MARVLESSGGLGEILKPFTASGVIVWVLCCQEMERAPADEQFTETGSPAVTTSLTGDTSTVAEASGRERERERRRKR